MGIEPTTKAWEALVLPLNYTRIGDSAGHLGKLALPARRRRFACSAQADILPEKAIIHRAYAPPVLCTTPVYSGSASQTAYPLKTHTHKTPPANSNPDWAV